MKNLFNFETQSWLNSARSVLTVFICSRILIFGVWSCLACLQIMAPTGNNIFRPAMITLDRANITASISDIALYNDAGWYESIARDGYEVRPFDELRQANWAFFPLHPLLWRGAMLLTGESILSGLLIANLFFLLALLSLHRLILTIDSNMAIANLTVAIVAFFPTSYFFSLPWSESLFLFLSVSSFLAAANRQWFLLFLTGAGACACRFVGIALVPSILLFLWPHRHSLPRKAWVALGLVPTGLAMFMFELWSDTGNAFAFSDIQSAWGRALTIPYKAVGVVLLKPYVIASDWNLRPLNFLTLLGGLYGAYWLAVRRRQPAFACFLALGLLAPVMTGSITSMARYGMSLFPLSFAMAYVSDRHGVDKLWLALSSALLALLAIGFQARLSFAGA